TLYLCQSIGSTNSPNSMIAALNFTGPSPNNQNSGKSFICINSAVTQAFFTNGGSTCIQANTPNLPWLNIQTKYYVGFWSASGQNGQITFLSSGTSAVFTDRANAMYYWIPPTITTA